MRNLEERFWRKVDKHGPNGCWIWRACTVKGYGQFWLGGRNVPAHRLSYELCVGNIPEGLTIDHLCRNRNCQNPLHLEPVTMRTNVLRGDTITAKNATMTHCHNGHILSGSNVYVRNHMRTCRSCKSEAARRRRGNWVNMFGSTCNCGCGDKVSKGARWRRGHWKRGTIATELKEME